MRSYFQATRRRAARTIARFPERVADIEVIVTGSEAEALHLEQNLVKRHRPPFNVRLRDDKSFPYIAVTVEDDYPRVMFTRERHRRGVVYFGPYANAKKVRETLDVLNRVFPYRPCEGPKPGRHSGIPCLDYHIERCLAPCVGYVSKEDYRADHRRRDRVPLRRDAADPARARAEDAARPPRASASRRRRATATACSRSATWPSGRPPSERAVGDVDVIGIAVDGDRAAVQVFPLRDGRMIDRYGFHLENVEGQDTPTLLEAFCLEYYGVVAERAAADRRAAGRGRHARRSRSSSPSGAAHGSRCGAPCAARSGGCRSSRPRTRGSRWSRRPLQSERQRLRRVEALEELREALNLESLPLRIECFDISNIQG